MPMPIIGPVLRRRPERRARSCRHHAAAARRNIAMVTMVAAPFQDVDEGGQPPLAAAAAAAAAARSTDTADAVDGMLAAVDLGDAGILSLPDTTTCAVAAAGFTSAERKRLLLLLSDRRDEGGSLVAVGGGSSWDHGLGFRLDCWYSTNSTARQRCAGIVAYPKSIVGLVEIRVLFGGPRAPWRDARERRTENRHDKSPHFAGQSK